MRCSHCSGTVFLHTEGDFQEGVCWNCGRRTYLRAGRSTSHTDRGSSLSTLVAHLPEEFRLIDLLNHLWAKGTGPWTPASLRQALSGMGYETTKPSRGSPLICRKVKRGSS